MGALEKVDVAIVGSGFAGLCMAIKLRAGRAARTSSSWRRPTGSAAPGGTTPTRAAPATSRRTCTRSRSSRTRAGPRMFAPWDEILAYLEHCATKYGIADKIRYGAEVTEAAFDEATGRWTVTVNGDETLETQALVAGVGNLHQPKLPDLRRPRHVRRQGVPLVAVGSRARPDRPPGRRHRDRRLARSSSSRRIAEQVAQLDLYQRTAPWITPKPDRAIGPRERALHERFPAGQRAIRDVIFWGLEARGARLRGQPKADERPRTPGPPPPPQAGHGSRTPGQADAGLPDRLQADPAFRTTTTRP